MEDSIEICNGAFELWDRGDRHAEISTAISPKRLSGQMLTQQDEALGRTPITAPESFLVVRNMIVAWVVSVPGYDVSLEYPECCLGSAFPGRVTATSGPLKHIEGAIVADIQELERMIGVFPRATHTAAVA